MFAEPKKKERPNNEAINARQQEAESLMAEIGPMIEELPADEAEEVVKHLDDVLQDCKEKVDKHKSDKVLPKVGEK